VEIPSFDTVLSQRKIPNSAFDKVNAHDVSYGWKKITNGVPQCLILGPLPFLVCIKDLPVTTDNDSEVVLFCI
jgi:hypothetical protein